MSKCDGKHCDGCGMERSSLTAFRPDGLGDVFYLCKLCIQCVGRSFIVSLEEAKKKEAANMRKIKVNGKVCEAEVDDKGVLRFKRNRIVCHLIDLAGAKGLCDLYMIALMTCNGLFSVEERMEFYRQIGYSVDGYQEVFPEAEVEEIDE